MKTEKKVDRRKPKLLFVLNDGEYLLYDCTAEEYNTLYTEWKKSKWSDEGWKAISKHEILFPESSHKKLDKYIDYFVNKNKLEVVVNKIPPKKNIDVSHWTDEYDDTLGYLGDYVKTYADKNGITSQEDVWQKDLHSREFMIEVLAACGVFNEEEE